MNGPPDAHVPSARVYLQGRRWRPRSAPLTYATNGDTLLLIIRQLPLPAPTSARLLGVDDCAFSRGETYGALLVDLEAHQRVGMFADYTADRLLP